MSLILEYLGNFGLALHPINAAPVLINPVKLPELGQEKPSHILITHDFGNLKQSIQIAKDAGCPVVVGEVLSNWLHERYPELATITLCIGEELTLPWATIVQLESGCVYALEGVSQDVDGHSFIVSAYGHQIFFGGAMPFTTDIKQIGLNYRPNVSILGLGEQLIKTDEIGHAVMLLGSDIVLPIAPNTGETVDMNEVFATIDIYTPAICRVLNTGDSYGLQPTESTGRSSGPESRY